MFIHIGHSLGDLCRDEPSAEHDLRGVVVLTFKHSKPSSLHSLTFRATIFSRFGCSEPPFLPSLTFRAIILSRSRLSPFFGSSYIRSSSHCSYLGSPSFLILVFRVASLALSFKVTAPDIHIHWHCTSYLRDFAFVLGFPHLATLCLSLIHHAFLDFSFHYT
ncbi:hypothetical protein AAG906_025134 [Vitis piasezkii]